MARRRALTEEMVTMRTKCNRMDLIKNLNVWGNDLDDVSVLQYMPNLEVLSLSVNCLSSLADLKYCPKLSELYLRKNEIYDLAEVLNLRHHRQMRVLWLCDNPCANLPHYRQFVLHHLPNLTKLDSNDVTDGERHQALEADLSSVQTCVADMAYDDEPKRAASAMTLTQQRRGSEPDFEDQHLGLPERTHSSSSVPVNGELRHGEFYRDEASMRNGAAEQQWHERSPCARPVPASPASACGGGSPQWQPRHQLSGGGSSPGSHGASFERAPPRSHAVPRGGAPVRTSAVGGYEESLPQQGWCEEIEAVPSQPLSATDNILCAVLALIKELDGQGLELVRRAVEQRQEDVR